MFDMLDRAGELLEEGLDPLLKIRIALGELAAEGRDHWTGPALSERLTELVEVRERIEAEVLRLTGEWDHNRVWEADGSLSAAAWLAHRTATSRRDARRLVKSARIAGRHDPIGESLHDGTITSGHVDVMVRAVSRGREPILADHVSTLVDAARTLSVDDFGTVMRRWACLADDVMNEDTFEKKWERRHCHLSAMLDGWVAISGMVDAVTGQTLAQALDHLAPPDPTDMPDGPRTLSQRRADALADLANWYLNGAKPNGNPPHLNVVVDVGAITGERIDQVTSRRDLEGIGPITQQALDQLACCGAVSRVLMAGPSHVLDLGRATRLATPAQRRALTVRDRHCRFPGCRRLPQWCDVHHIAGWFEDDGPTDLNNLSL